MRAACCEIWDWCRWCAPLIVNSQGLFQFPRPAAICLVSRLVGTLRSESCPKENVCLKRYPAFGRAIVLTVDHNPALHACFSLHLLYILSKFCFPVDPTPMSECPILSWGPVTVSSTQTLETDFYTYFLHTFVVWSSIHSWILACFRNFNCMESLQH